MSRPKFHDETYDEPEVPQPAWKHLLEPYAAAYGELVTRINRLSDDELDAFLEACAEPTQTNCGWSTYRVVVLLLPEAQAEKSLRERVKAASLGVGSEKEDA